MKEINNSKNGIQIPTEFSYRELLILFGDIKKKCMINTFNDDSIAKEAHLDLLAAKFFFSCNVPFVVASNKYFLEFCKQMQPSYKSPSHKRLAGSLLDTVYREQVKLNAKLLKGASSVLLIDG